MGFLLKALPGPQHLVIAGSDAPGRPVTTIGPCLDGEDPGKQGLWPLRAHSEPGTVAMSLKARLPGPPASSAGFLVLHAGGRENPSRSHFTHTLADLPCSRFLPLQRASYLRTVQGTAAGPRSRPADFLPQPLCI